MKYCVVKYEPFYERYAVIAEFVRLQDAKQFAMSVNKTVEEQLEFQVVLQQATYGGHGKFVYNPHYIFACRKDLIDEYIELFFDEVPELIVAEY